MVFGAEKEAERAKLEKRTKVDLRSSLIAGASARGQTMAEVNRDYFEQAFKPLPWAELGFASLEAMLTAWTDICTVYGGLVYPVATEETAHTLKLVQQQRRVKPTLRERKGRARASGFFHAYAEAQNGNTGLHSDFGRALFPPNAGPAALPVAFRKLSSGKVVGGGDPTGAAKEAQAQAQAQAEPPSQVQGRVLSSGRVVGSGPVEYRTPPSSPAVSGSSPSPARVGVGSGLEKPGSHSPSIISLPSTQASLHSAPKGLVLKLQAKFAHLSGANEAKEIPAKWRPHRMEIVDDWDASAAAKGKDWGIRAGRLSLPVRLTQYQDLSALYLIQEASVVKLLQLNKSMDAIYGGEKPLEEAGAAHCWAPLPKADIEVGLHCVAQLPDYGWNRSVVQQIGQRKARVFCVDFGTEAVVPLTNLHRLPACLAQTPQFARCVRLNGWDPATFEVPDEGALEKAVIGFCGPPEETRLAVDLVEVGKDGKAVVNLFRESPERPADWQELAPCLLQNGIVRQRTD